MARSRLGVVLPVPAAAAPEVRGLARALGFAPLVPPHVTVVPPVNVRAADVPAALEVAARAAAAVAPVAAVMGPAATFSPATPVVYLAVSGPGVQTVRDLVFDGPLRRPLTWPFVPHVTLADEAPDPVAAAVALESYSLPVVFDRLDVMRESAGRWEVFASFALGGPRVVGTGGLPVSIDMGSSPDALASELLGGFTVTARRSGSVCGVATGRVAGQLWLERLVVTAPYEGIGSQLLRAVEDVGRAEGCSVGVHVCPEPVVSWFAARGWLDDGAMVPGWSRVVRSLPQ